MITYDWIQRIKKDCKDFLENKIPNKDYDFEIIYNAYPERVQGEVPWEVISLVAKELGKVISRNPEPYIDFLKFIQENKDDIGKKIFNSIMKKVALRYPDKYYTMLKDVIHNTHEESNLKKLFDNIILPLLKKYPEKYLDKLIEWVRLYNSDKITKNIFGTLSNYIKKTDKKNATEVFKKCESFWNSDNQSIRTGNALILKTIFKVNRKLYQEIYCNYQSTYNPNFIDILSSAVCEESEIIRQLINKWNKSGNIRIKKAATIARKNISKMKKKENS
ncbi:MAG: hypothetical protein ISS28_00200 [Candidatus Cloacimonetes bacterium]|nr:hypothetical protein [Candidatus Cloacimonadota bacterium]